MQFANTCDKCTLRLLVYSEIESLGIKGFLNQLLPKVGFQFLSDTQTPVFHCI